MRKKNKLFLKRFGESRYIKEKVSSININEALDLTKWEEIPELVLDEEDQENQEESISSTVMWHISCLLLYFCFQNYKMALFPFSSREEQKNKGRKNIYIIFVVCKQKFLAKLVTVESNGFTLSSFQNYSFHI